MSQSCTRRTLAERGAWRFNESAPHCPPSKSLDETSFRRVVAIRLRCPTPGNHASGGRRLPSWQKLRCTGRAPQGQNYSPCTRSTASLNPDRAVGRSGGSTPRCHRGYANRSPIVVLSRPTIKKTGSIQRRHMRRWGDSRGESDATLTALVPHLINKAVVLTTPLPTGGRRQPVGCPGIQPRPAI